ncbi:hypothetical protein AMELA_G00279640 [Ameiurus melas]|uniref:Uncharacterized protein n=1 Tax=Ameiurus melas TaxID=219545 RepID=A0A7J5ZJW1_AMEME|nr:hypothetical protein AMELA_G00279640 [Ameiurus melas]
MHGFYLERVLPGRGAILALWKRAPLHTRLCVCGQQCRYDSWIHHSWNMEELGVEETTASSRVGILSGAAFGLSASFELLSEYCIAPGQRKSLRPARGSTLHAHALPSSSALRSP